MKTDSPICIQCRPVQDEKDLCPSCNLRLAAIRAQSKPSVIESKLTDAEKYHQNCLHDLHVEYRQKAKVHIDALKEIASLRPPLPVFVGVNHEQN